MITKTQEDFVWGALIGGALGAAAILLLTPFSGSELRQQIQDGFGRLNGAKPRRSSSSSHASVNGSSRPSRQSIHTAAKKPKRTYKRAASKKSAAASQSHGHAHTTHSHGHAKPE